MKWDNNILTDSGGYQVYSLSNNRNPDGLNSNHIDGYIILILKKQLISKINWS